MGKYEAFKKFDNAVDKLTKACPCDNCGLNDEEWYCQLQCAEFQKFENEVEKMNKANQRMRILNYMEKNGGITGLEATNVLHIMDYRKRISEMRRNGINIGDVWERRTDGDGMPVRFKRYFLIED